MIELKPYRGTSPSSSDQKKKGAVGGKTLEDKHAYLLVSDPATFSLLGSMAAVLSLFVTLITGSFIWVCVVPITCLLGIALMNRVWQNYLGDKLGEPRLFVSANRVRRGDQIDVHFQHSIRRDLVIEDVKLELVMQEWVKDYQGKSITESTYDFIVQTTLDPQQYPLAVGYTYKQHTQFTLPQRAMHSFVFPDNSLTWLIRVHFKVKDFTSLTESYAIQVTPEVHTL